MKVTMMLADAAQAVNGKLYILGGGWSITGPGVPSAIAIKIEVDWNDANRRKAFLLQLLDADGQPVRLPTPEGEQTTLEIRGDFEVGRPAGLIPGTPLDAAVAINIGPLPLPPGRRYVWRVSIDGQTNPEWEVGFSTRPAQQVPPFQPPPGLRQG
jgi:hypothetical protein